MVNLRTFVIALATFAALVILGSTANAGYSVIHQNIHHNSDGSTTVHTLIENDETGQQGVHWLQIYEDGSYDSGIVVIGESNPQPDGSPSGVVDVEGLILEMLKDGSLYLEQPDFFETPFGKQLVETGKTGSIVPYHNPSDALTRDGDGGPGGGTGGIDPNGGGIIEQIKKNGGGSSDNDDDGDDSDSRASNAGTDDSYLLGSPHLVNPVPFEHSRANVTKFQPAPVVAVRR